LSSLLTKGYDKLSYDKIKLTFEEKSSSLSGFSGKNAYGLLMHGLSENIKDLFPHFAGALLRPDMPQKFLSHEKQMVLRALTNQKKIRSNNALKKFSNSFSISTLMPSIPLAQVLQ